MCTWINGKCKCSFRHKAYQAACKPPPKHYNYRGQIAVKTGVLGGKHVANIQCREPPAGAGLKYVKL